MRSPTARRSPHTGSQRTRDAKTVPGRSAPLILITPSTARHGEEFADASVSLSNAYPLATAAAGGIPWIPFCATPATLISEFVRRSDGVILTGGDDIQPALYEADLTPRLKKTISPADPLRDAFELAVIREVFRQRKPLLAICRGQQLVNVAFGGTLIVDIALQVANAFNHSRTDLKDRIVHDVEIQAGSLLHNIFKTTRLGVNSSHHQAVGRVAEPFQVTARGPDGVIECLELAPQNARLLPYFLAVQFHPERLVQPHPEFLKLFKSFIRACRSVSNEA